MPNSHIECADCGAEFEAADHRPGDRFECSECGASVEVPGEARPAARAGIRKGASPGPAASRGGARRKKPAKKNSTAVLAVAGVLALVGGGVALFLFLPSKVQVEPTVSDREAVSGADTATRSGESSIFDASAVDARSAQDGPQRVLVGEPRTVDMEPLTKHLGHLYLNPETSTEIKQLKEEVERLKRERYHVTDAAKKSYKALLAKVSAEEHDPFLERADSELNKLNIRFEKTDLRLRDTNDQPFPVTFSGFVFRPYVFFVQNHKDGGEAEIAAKIHDQLTQLKEAFVADFGQFIKLAENPRHNIIYVMLLRTFSDYQNYNRIAEPFRDTQMTLAHYEPNNRRLVVPLTYGNRRGEKSEEEAEHEAREVMFHEGTHQILHYYASTDDKGAHLSAYGAMWSDEGVAEYFGGHTMDADGRFKFGRINSRVEAVARDQNDRKRRLDMVNLLRWSRSEYEREKNKDFNKATNIHLGVYAEGWALVHFLNHYENGKYRKKYEDIMKQQIESGDTGMPVFRRVFGDDFDRVVEEFNDYMDAMTNAFRKRQIEPGTTFPK
ncbi:MAG: DUF1570 domain-containing protein [Planctomycetes bacterium]|nr:DUF1570 domain-containing protein [Planctomycetota bacterium]